MVFAAYALISAVATWPLLRDFGSRLGGDHTDPFQTLWGFWWWRHSLQFGDWPMYTRFLWWPDGLPLWFQTWDLPSTIATAPLWGFVPPFAIYNLALFLSFPLSGLTFYFLCREIWGGRLAPFLAGCLYTFSTFHFGQALSNLHIVSMQWSPIYFLGLIRMIRRPGYGGAVIAGVGLSLAFMASAYHALFCLVGTVCLAAFNWAYGERRIWSKAFVRRVSVMAAVFAIGAGWLVVAMLRAYVSEPYVGQHPPVDFSADIQSFFLFNAASVWSRYFDAWRPWTGSQWVSVGYIGYVALALGLAAWRSMTARAFLFVALIGALLALGPQVQYGGALTRIVAPYFFVHMLPGMAFAGLPSRFTWMTSFGVAVAACGGLAMLCRRGAVGRTIAVVVVALSLVETWPHALTMSTWPSPPMLAPLAADRAEWAVLDATEWPRALWHQLLHQHPMLGGYTSRAPDRVWTQLKQDAALYGFFPPPIGPLLTPPLAIPAARVIQRLRDLKIRFVIVGDKRTEMPQAVGLLERYRGDGIVIYEVGR